MVTLTVNPLPDVPVALNDNFQTLEDAILQLDSVTGLLANDVDLDKGALRINTTPLTAPLKGSLILAEDGSFTYTPEADFNGIDSFTYQLVSENNLTSSANVNITVEAVNDAPTVINDNAVVDEDSDVMVDVLANDTDKEGDNLILTSVDIEEGTALIVNNSISLLLIILSMTHSLEELKSGQLIGLKTTSGQHLKWFPATHCLCIQEAMCCTTQVPVLRA